MKNYYAILGLKTGCTTKDIRRAYRALAKNIHPDKMGEDGTDHFLLIKEAYEILISPLMRDSYDKAYRVKNRETNIPRWDYHDFLLERKNKPEFCVKLITFDLLNDKTDEAVNIYEKSGGFFFLKEGLDREDFMDYGFLLAEAYMEKKAVVKAYRILRGLAHMEEEDPYFRHFYIEVLNRLASIVKQNIPDDEQNYLRMTFLSDLLTLSYPAKEEAKLRVFLSELLMLAGKQDAAIKEVFHAYKLAPKLSGLAEKLKILEQLGISNPP